MTRSPSPMSALSILQETSPLTRCTNVNTGAEEFMAVNLRGRGRSLEAKDGFYVAIILM